MTASVFWTGHLTSGNEQQVSLYDNTREVIVIAVQGDSYISPNANTHPPALSSMTSSDAWDGAVIRVGTSQRFKLRNTDVPDGVLYVGTVTASAAASTLSVIAVVD